MNDTTRIRLSVEDIQFLRQMLAFIACGHPHPICDRLLRSLERAEARIHTRQEQTHD